MITKHLAARVAVYILGLLCLAFGITFAINSNLGTTPVNALPLVASRIFNVTIGVSVTVFFSLCLLLQIVLLRKEFKPINLTQLIYSFIFGYFVDFAEFVVGDFIIPTYAGQMTMLAISLIFIPSGLSLYLEAKLVPMPPEGLVVSIMQKLPKTTTFAIVKVILDCALVALAIALAFIFLGGAYGVREGTVILAIFIGKLMPYTRKVISYVLGKLGFYPPESTEPPKEAAENTSVTADTNDS